MIYFIQNKATKAIKIGFTGSDVQQRLRQLQTACADRLEVLAIEEGEIADERKLHERFREHRMSGEWFKPHEEVMTEIATITGVPPEVRAIRESGQIFPELCYLTSFAVHHSIEIYRSPMGYQVMPGDDCGVEMDGFFYWHIDHKPQWFKLPETACCAYVASHRDWISKGKPDPDQ